MRIALLSDGVFGLGPDDVQFHVAVAEFSECCQIPRAQREDDATVRASFAPLPFAFPLSIHENNTVLDKLKRAAFDDPLPLQGALTGLDFPLKTRLLLELTHKLFEFRTV